MWNSHRRSWLLGAPPSRGMTTSNIANRKQASFSRRASSPERCKILPREARSPGRTWKERGGASVSLFATPVSPKPRNKERNKGSGTPADADQYPPHLAMRRAPCKARSPFGVPPRLSPKGIIPSQRLSFRPGFLGRGLHGRYPPSPVPVQGCTSHPGRNAGRHDAQAARKRGVWPHPRAPPSLRRRRVPSADSVLTERD
jgi:hypothetical protein